MGRISVAPPDGRSPGFGSACASTRSHSVRARTASVTAGRNRAWLFAPDSRHRLSNGTEMSFSRLFEIMSILYASKTAPALILVVMAVVLPNLLHDHGMPQPGSRFVGAVAG